MHSIKNMKHLSFILAIGLLLASCGGGNDKPVEEIIENGSLDEIRAKRAEIITLQKQLNSEIAMIDKAIEKLDTTEKLPLVTVFPTKSQVFNHYLEIQGDVSTRQNIVLYPEFNGVLTKIHVKEGQQVRKGQLLASIDDGGLAQQLAQMEVQAELARTTFERQQRLWDQKIGSEIAYLQAKTNFEAQSRAVDQMRAQVAKTQISAPFSGVIDDVIADPGTVVAAGQSPVFRLVNLGDMFVQADIPETYLGSMQIGKEVTAYFPVLGDTIQAQIRQVGNHINPTNRTFKIEIGLPGNNRLIKPNLTAKLNINDYTNEQAILIPQSVISENASGQQYVFVTRSTGETNKAKAQRVFVRTGKVQGDYVEILEGLKDGDTIVQEGARSVKDGQKVEILNVTTNE
jgi:RND family efflux transporter MFP subunit